MFPPKHLKPLVQRQLGLITRRQVIENGCTAAAVSSWLRRGQLETVYTAVYKVAGSAVTPEQRLLAAALRAGADARLTGWSAGALYGLDGTDFGWTPWVVIPRKRRVQEERIVVQRSELGRGEVRHSGAGAARSGVAHRGQCVACCDR
jgi:hypothetical protein